MTQYTTLEAVWFVLIGVLWTGYLVLEGFDFGVGMLLRHVGRTTAERRAVIHTIGPVWDGNEVWLLVAGGATFAAFPNWYATLFSGFYTALLLILLALIVRNVAFEFWGKEDSAGWRTAWEWAIVIGSFVPALLWGVAWANIVHGVPIDAKGDFTGNLLDLLHPYALLGGVAFLLLFLTHGAAFLTLRLEGPTLERAIGSMRAAAPAAAAATIAFLAWTVAHQGSHGGVQAGSAACAAVAAVCAVATVVLARARSSLTFAATAGTIVMTFVALLVDLFPYVMVSSTSSAYSITLHEAASSQYTLTVMTVVAAVFVPLVLLYQGWTYRVFRHRLSPDEYEAPRTPVDVLPGHGSDAGG